MNNFLDKLIVFNSNFSVELWKENEKIKLYLFVTCKDSFTDVKLIVEKTEFFRLLGDSHYHGVKTKLMEADFVVADGACVAEEFNKKYNLSLSIEENLTSDQILDIFSKEILKYLNVSSPKDWRVVEASGRGTLSSKRGSFSFYYLRDKNSFRICSFSADLTSNRSHYTFSVKPENFVFKLENYDKVNGPLTFERVIKDDNLRDLYYSLYKRIADNTLFSLFNHSKEEIKMISISNVLNLIEKAEKILPVEKFTVDDVAAIYNETCSIYKSPSQPLSKSLKFSTP